MDPDEARRRFSEARVARLATAGLLGQPHIVPVVFALDGDTIYSIVDSKPKRTLALARLRNIQENRRVALLVDEYSEDWGALWWVRADGVAEVVDDGPDRDRAIGLLTARYEQYRTGAEPIGAAVLVSVERWIGWTTSEQG